MMILMSKLPHLVLPKRLAIRGRLHDRVELVEADDVVDIELPVQRVVDRVLRREVGELVGELGLVGLP